MQAWILIALSCYFFVAVSDVFDKIVRTNFIKNSYALVVLNGFLNLAIAVVLISLSPSVLLAPDKGLMVLSGIIGIIASIPYFHAMSKGEASRIIPLFNLVPIFSLLLAFFFLGQGLSNLELVAFVPIVIGGFLISMERTKGMFRLNAGFWLVIFSAFLYAVSFVVIQHTLQVANYYTVQVFVALGYFAGGMLVIPYSLLLRKVKAHEFHYNIIGVGLQGVNQTMYLISRLLLNITLTLAPVALAVSFGGFTGFYVLIITSLLSLYYPKILKENLSKSILMLKIMALVLLFVGVSILAFS